MKHRPRTLYRHPKFEIIEPFKIRNGKKVARIWKDPKRVPIRKDLATVARWLKLNKLWAWYEAPSYGRIVKSAKAGRVFIRRKPSFLRGLFAWYRYLDHPITVKDVLLILLALLLLWALFFKDHYAIAEPVKPSKMPAIATYKPLKQVKLSKQGKLTRLYQKPATAPVQSSGTTSCGSNYYMAQIYRVESGCRTWAVNPSSGAYGLCQALPGIKMASFGSDWKTSWATQNAWCIDYANRTYGSPALAWAAWQRQNWW